MIKKGRLYEIIPLIAGFILFVEGLTIFAVAGPTFIDGIGGILKSTVQLGGFQLFIISMIVLICSIFLIFDSPGKGRRELPKRALNFLIFIMGIVVASEGIVLAFMGGKTTIEGFGTLEAYTVAGFAAQLFFLGMAIVVPSILHNKAVGLRKLLVYGGGIAAASSGLAIVGVAAMTDIQGIGTVFARTIELAGEQLSLIGLAIVILSLLLDLTDDFRMPISTMRYLAACVVTVEGLALISLATPINIQGIGGITSRTLILSGFGLALIGLFTLFVSGLPTQKLSPRLSRITMASVLFLTLLLPFAALTYGQVF